MAKLPLLTLLRSQDPRAFFQISGDWKALLRMHFLHAAMDTRLLPALYRPRTREELETELEPGRPELLAGLLDLGVSLGELSLKGGRYQVKGNRSRALRQEKNDALAALVQANVTYYNDVFRGLARRMKGGPLDPDMEAIGPLVARVSKIAEPYLEHFLGKAVEGKGPLKVLDVGCGSGVHLKTALDRNPEVLGTGLEVDPGVVLQARENLEGWGVADRLSVLQGDVRHPPEEAEGPFDLVLLFSVVYYFQVPERIAVLRAVRETLTPGGRVAVAVSCGGVGMDHFSANLNLATSSLQGLTPLPTPEEMESQLREAGFQAIDRTRLIPRTTYFGFMAS